MPVQMWTRRFVRTNPDLDELCLVTMWLSRCYFLWLWRFEDGKHMSTEDDTRCTFVHNTLDVTPFNSVDTNLIKGEASQGGGLNPTCTSTTPSLKVKGTPK